MTELILFILATIGLTFIISLHYIFKRIRNFLEIKSPKYLGKMINCTACVGFWVGLIIRIIQILSLGLVFNYDLILYGFVGSFVSYIAYLLLRYFMDKYD